MKIYKKHELLCLSLCRTYINTTNNNNNNIEMYAHAFYISYKLKFLAIYIIKNSSGEVGEGGGLIYKIHIFCCCCCSFSQYNTQTMKSYSPAINL